MVYVTDILVHNNYFHIYLALLKGKEGIDLLYGLVCDAVDLFNAVF